MDPRGQRMNNALQVGEGAEATSHSRGEAWRRAAPREAGRAKCGQVIAVISVLNAGQSDFNPHAHVSYFLNADRSRCFSKRPHGTRLRSDEVTLLIPPTGCCSNDVGGVASSNAARSVLPPRRRGRRRNLLRCLAGSWSQMEPSLSN